MNSTLLLALFFCHWMADFSPLSTAWMLKAKQTGSPIFPIFVHACVHGLLMFVAFLLLETNFKTLLLFPIGFQIITHFIIDVLKGKVSVWISVLADPSSKWHWFVFGMDQFLHATVIISMLAMWDTLTICAK